MLGVGSLLHLQLFHEVVSRYLAEYVRHEPMHPCPAHIPLLTVKLGGESSSANTIASLDQENVMSYALQSRDFE